MEPERTGLPWMMTSEVSESDEVEKSPGLIERLLDDASLCLAINGLRSVNVLDVFLAVISEIWANDPARLVRP